MTSNLPAALAAHVSSVCDAAQGSLVFLDRALRVVHCNDFALRWVKRPADEVVGKHCYQVFHGSEAACPDCPTLQAFATAEVARATHSGVAADGTTTWADITAFPVLEDGQVRYVVEYAADVSTRVAAERERTELVTALRESEERYRTMVEHSNDLIWTLDRRGNFTWFNRQAEELTGNLRADWVGRSFELVIVREDLPLARRMFAETLAGCPRSFEVRARARHGAQLVLLVNSAPMYQGGEIVGTVSFGKDITERKLAEERLRALYEGTDEQLRRKLVELTAALAAADRERERSREVERQRQDFLQMVTHDLRGPLNAAVLSAEAVRRSLAVRNDPACLRHVEAILRSARAIDGMIADLIDSARYEAGHLSLDRQDVAAGELVQDLVSSLALPDQTRVQLVCDAAVPFVSADRRRMARALANLVTNALKYAPEDSPVTIRVSVSGGHVAIAVIDSGDGIDAEDLPHVFERFYRAGSSRGSAGLGLGLYITRIIVEAHGGRVGVESLRGQGSTFVITLPCAPTLDRSLTT